MLVRDHQDLVEIQHQHLKQPRSQNEWLSKKKLLHRTKYGYYGRVLYMMICLICGCLSWVKLLISFLQINVNIIIPFSKRSTAKWQKGNLEEWPPFCTEGHLPQVLHWTNLEGLSCSLLLTTAYTIYLFITACVGLAVSDRKMEPALVDCDRWCRKTVGKISMTELCHAWMSALKWCFLTSLCIFYFYLVFAWLPF